LNELYELGGTFATLDGEIVLLAGSTVGGGSAVKTPDYVLTDWSENHNLPLFSSHEYLSAMDTVCERIGVIMFSEKVVTNLVFKSIMCREIHQNIITVVLVTMVVEKEINKGPMLHGLSMLWNTVL